MVPGDRIMLNVFAQQTPPEEFYSLLILPTLLSAIGLVVYFLGQKREASVDKAPWKWAGLIPIVIALFVGVQSAFVFLSDPFYREVAYGRKMMLGHIGAAAIPALMIVVILVWDVVNRRARARYY
jgi:hypothetical protein